MTWSLGSECCEGLLIGDLCCNVEVRIDGAEPRKALVMTKLGTIPEEREVEMPWFEKGGG